MILCNSCLLLLLLICFSYCLWLLLLFFLLILFIFLPSLLNSCGLLFLLILFLLFFLVFFWLFTHKRRLFLYSILLISISYYLSYTTCFLSLSKTLCYWIIINILIIFFTFTNSTSNLRSRYLRSRFTKLCCCLNILLILSILILLPILLLFLLTSHLLLLLRSLTILLR